MLEGKGTTTVTIPAMTPSDSSSSMGRTMPSPMSDLQMRHTLEEVDSFSSNWIGSESDLLSGRGKQGGELWTPTDFSGASSEVIQLSAHSSG